MAFCEIVVELLLLVAALSVDTLVAALAYGSSGIKISWRVTAVISLVCSLTLGVALQLGTVLLPVLPLWLTRWLPVGIMLVLGIMRLLDSSFKSWIRERRRVTITVAPLQLILIIYADPEEADRDQSRSLSAGEAISLGLALSLDSLAVGFGVGLARYPVIPVFLLSFAFGMGAIAAGKRLGETVAGKSSGDLGWLSGVLLILLALARLF